MLLRVLAIAGVAGVNIAALGAGVVGQLDQRAFAGSSDHPAIEYATRPTRDPVATLNRLIEAGDVELRWEVRGGYLRSQVVR